MGHVVMPAHCWILSNSFMAFPHLPTPELAVFYRLLHRHVHLNVPTTIYWHHTLFWTFTTTTIMMFILRLLHSWMNKLMRFFKFFWWSTFDQGPIAWVKTQPICKGDQISHIIDCPCYRQLQGIILSCVETQCGSLYFLYMLVENYNGF